MLHELAVEVELAPNASAAHGEDGVCQALGALTGVVIARLARLSHLNMSWQTSNMGKAKAAMATVSAKGSKRTSSKGPAGKPLSLDFADLNQFSKIHGAAKFAQRSSASEFIVPKLTGAEAAKLMKALGVLTPTGKLTNSYR